VTPQHLTHEPADAHRVSVVLLRHTSAGLVPFLGRTPIDMSATTVDPDLLEECLDSAVLLVAPAGVPQAIVDAVQVRPVPGLFARTPLLRQHRALTFTDSGESVDGHNLRYHKEFGVCVDEDT
jgi:hypothetical protein